jgi:sugar-specific transcriptional regulator TrmB
MDELENEAKAIELLQQLGLKEYEAKCFVALSRLPSGTAKEISDHSDVPRTRVYDATRVLESKGLVEVQHSSPQQFRGVSIDEATNTLRQEYRGRTDELRDALAALDPISTDGDTEVTHEVWSLSGSDAVETRANALINEAEREVVLVLGASSVVTDALFDQLSSAQDRGLGLLIGTVDADLRGTVEDRLPSAKVFVSGLEWLASGAVEGDNTEISRLLMIDRGTILVSTRNADGTAEKAVFGRGFDNGIVTIGRRLISTGVLPGEEPEWNLSTGGTGGENSE